METSASFEARSAPSPYPTLSACTSSSCPIPRFADVVLPARMFLEHDDIYTASAHQFLQFAPKTIDPPEGCRWNS